MSVLAPKPERVCQTEHREVPMLTTHEGEKVRMPYAQSGDGTR